MKTASTLSRWFLVLAVAISLPLASVSAAGAVCWDSHVKESERGDCCCGEECQCGPTCSAGKIPSQEDEAPAKQPERRVVEQFFASSADGVVWSMDVRPLPTCESSALRDGPHLVTLVSQHICLQV